MKKIINTLIVFLLLVGNSHASDYILTSSDKLLVNKLSYKIQNILNKSNLETRKKLEDKINKLQNQYKNNEKLNKIFEEIKINTHLISYKNEYLSHYKKYNIDFKTIQNNWLKRHNKVRASLGENLYSYDERLDNTAYEWSKTQAEEKKMMSHIRNNGDKYYDYKKIEKWFNDRGVKCKVVGGATTSESIGKYGYYCNDNDCTDELDNSLKEIFDIYMSEKGLGGFAEAHYRGITHKDLTKIGLGLRIEEVYDDTYRDYRSFNYYVTTHYCTSFKK